MASKKTTNYFSPLFPTPYAFSGAPGYNNADVPSTNGLVGDHIELARKLAYERYQSSQITGEYSNPPFLSGAAGRISPVLRDNGVPRILRGYIRRANYDDQASRSRLYFMFNPEVITRDYVSYLDQAALDPFNTVFGSDNLVAPPSFMNFSFELFFDRQDEVSQDLDHPGVFVDYQFFDLVVRNVLPTDPGDTNNALPDNGVMMVNPRDITVVFSPQITIQGRPINARVSFEKFSHRMTPTRMRISLEMRVMYVGPQRPATEVAESKYAAETADAVSPDDTKKFSFNFSDLVVAVGASRGAAAYTPSASAAVQTNLAGQATLFTPQNSAAATSALAAAKTLVQPGYTEYDRPRRGSGLDPNGLLHYTDCSGLVWWGFHKMGLTDKMGWGGSEKWPPATYDMLQAFEKNGFSTVDVIFKWTPATSASANLFFTNNRSAVQPGDILFRDQRMSTTGMGHVTYFDHWEGDRVFMFAASSKTTTPQVGLTSSSFQHFCDTYQYVFRAKPFGSLSTSASATGSPAIGQGPT